ncbi:mitochondrial ribosomal protein subunit L20-domain-containing protein [Elsinoe ampelina]|uniref:Mitochondrial ribosomal protein subunit L20-domain-containing protein n=1 Tax=Elsinoe ampelina TaxID=302913 RepID=A0A6A6GFG1_9PEZI|nr:mitochondrial ribosomal protein subunit L20-domain-containing protein [Elsinoe ampelina]
MRTLSRRNNALIPKPAHLQQQWRTEATARRLRKSLRVKSDPSFTAPVEETADHIIFNPPSSAPNVYHTPPIFLPASDPRRQFHVLAEQASSPKPANATAEVDATEDAMGPTRRLALSRLSRSSSALPPTIGQPRERKYHLGPDDVQEIRKLRAMDPKQWTVKRLAKFFDCNEFFIRLCASSPEAKAEEDAKIDAIKGRWGRTKREAREDRQKRKELWGRAD